MAPYTRKRRAVAGGDSSREPLETSETVKDGAVAKKKSASSSSSSAAKRSAKAPAQKPKSATADTAKANAAAPKNDYSHFQSWLMKSEGESRIQNGHDFKFSLNDLAASNNQTTSWEGVRNYQARNFMRDYMKLGQKGFFYHSNVKEPGIVGMVEIVRESYPDHTQFEKGNYYYDASSTKDSPRWFMVDVKLVRRLKRCITLKELKHWHMEHKQSGKGPLKDIFLFTRARLSVLPISDEEWEFITTLEDQPPAVE